jgi:hypothetical protein
MDDVSASDRIYPNRVAQPVRRPVALTVPLAGAHNSVKRECRVLKRHLGLCDLGQHGCEKTGDEGLNLGDRARVIK